MNLIGKKWMLLAAALLAVVVLVMSGRVGMPLEAQTENWEKAAGGKMAFEVASIRQNTSEQEPTVNFTLGPGDAYASNGGRLADSNISLFSYIAFAYKLTDSQKVLLQSQVPKWVNTERFDIEAKSDNHSPTKDQMRLMMQTLLAERFKLAVHTETRELPVLELVVAKAGKMGPQLRRHPADGPACSNLFSRQREPNATPGGSLTVDGGFPALCGDMLTTGVASAPSHLRLGARNVPIALLAARLNGIVGGDVDRPVLDRTGLTGNFDFVFEWGGARATDATAANAEPNDAGVTLLEALTDQLGLKLVRATGPVEVLVLDHVEQPSGN